MANDFRVERAGRFKSGLPNQARDVNRTVLRSCSPGSRAADAAAEWEDKPVPRCALLCRAMPLMA
jgi:hypothetical protein